MFVLPTSEVDIAFVSKVTNIITFPATCSAKCHEGPWVEITIEKVIKGAARVVDVTCEAHLYSYLSLKRSHHVDSVILEHVPSACNKISLLLWGPVSKLDDLSFYSTTTLSFTRVDLTIQVQLEIIPIFIQDPLHLWLYMDSTPLVQRND